MNILPALLVLALPLALMAAPFKDGDRIACFGDSITHQANWSQHLDNYYLTRFPEANILFINGGVGGDTAGGCQGRLDEDVTRHKPTAITVMFGMNDVGLGSYAAQPTPAQIKQQKSRYASYTNNMRVVAAKLKAGNPAADYYWFTPSPYDDTAEMTNKPAHRTANEIGLRRFAEFVRILQKKEGGHLVEMWQTMTDFNHARQKTDPAFTLCGRDRVHPQTMGALMMAYEFLKVQGAPAVVSHVALDVAANTCLKQENAAVSNISFRDGVFSCTILEKALPWPLSESVLKPVVDNTTIMDDFNRETFSVRGLPSGTWELAIDGKVIRAAAAEVWAAGVNLATCRETPMYQQSLAVTRKNECRTRVEAGPYRNLYGFRWFAGRRVKNVDDFEEMKTFVAKLDPTRGWFEKIAPSYIRDWPKREEFLKQMAELREATLKLNKPVPHTFTLRRK